MTMYPFYDPRSPSQCLIVPTNLNVSSDGEFNTDRLTMDDLAEVRSEICLTTDRLAEYKYNKNLSNYGQTR